MVYRPGAMVLQLPFLRGHVVSEEDELVIDCAEPEPLARFWAAALGYELEPPPAGFGSRDEYWRDIGIPEDELGIGADCIIDPAGRGPRIWFQVLPELKTAKTGSISTCGRPVPWQTRRPGSHAAARQCLTGARTTS
jgi:glyoxalase superfamily protein